MSLGYFCISNRCSKQAWHNSELLYRVHIAQCIYTHNMAAATMNIIVHTSKLRHCYSMVRSPDSGVGRLRSRNSDVWERGPQNIFTICILRHHDVAYFAELSRVTPSRHMRHLSPCNTEKNSTNAGDLIASLCCFLYIKLFCSHHTFIKI